MRVAGKVCRFRISASGREEEKRQPPVCTADMADPKCPGVLLKATNATRVVFRNTEPAGFTDWAPGNL